MIDLNNSGIKDKPISGLPPFNVREWNAKSEEEKQRIKQLYEDAKAKRKTTFTPQEIYEIKLYSSIMSNNGINREIELTKQSFKEQSDEEKNFWRTATSVDKSKDNTMLYLGIGVGILALFLIIK